MVRNLLQYPITKDEIIEFLQNEIEKRYPIVEGHRIESMSFGDVTIGLLEEAIKIIKESEENAEQT